MARAIGSAFVSATSRHMLYGLAPSRVVSRSARPPIACTAGSSANVSSSSAASAVDSICGRWLTHAHTSSCRAGSISITRAPNRSTSPIQLPLDVASPILCGREEPCGSAEQVALGERSAAGLFAGHRVPRQKFCSSRLVEELLCAMDDFQLGRADIGYELVFTEYRSQAFHPIKDWQHWRGEDDYVCDVWLLNSFAVFEDAVDRSHAQSSFELTRARVPAENFAGEVVEGLEGEADRGSDQACADDQKLHGLLSRRCVNERAFAP